MKKLGMVFGGLIFAAFMVNEASAADSKAVNLGGFVDAQGHWKKDGGSEGFSLYDAALYISKEFGNGKVMVDLPFKYAGTAGANDFSIATGKAQAYLSYSCMDGMITTTAGQFDAIFGFEAADSADAFFARTSFLGTASDIPAVHTGLMLSVKPKMNMNGNLGVNALVSNAQDRGQKEGEHFQFGGQFTFDNDMWRANYLWNRIKATSTGTNVTTHELVASGVYKF